MHSAIIHDLPDWRVTSWGNGLAYEVEHKPSGFSLFHQGDSASEFREEFDSLTSGVPALNFADALQVICGAYEDFAA